MINPPVNLMNEWPNTSSFTAHLQFDTFENFPANIYIGRALELWLV